MDGKKARMVFTDPPWNVDYGGDNNPKYLNRTIMNDKMSHEDFYKFILSALKVMATASEPGAMAYLVMSSKEWGTAMSAMRDAGYHWSSTIIWAKDSHVISRKDYHTQYEPIWYGWLKSAAGLCHLEDRGQSDLWQIPRPKKSEEHPTMKPIELVARTITNSSRTNDIVLDLFGGSGTTLMAAEQTGREARLMDLDPRFCDVIAQRFAKMQETDKDIFSHRNGERFMYHEIPENPSVS
jgi:DNA modification methylase